MTSRTTCSASAVESTIIALMPPVSAIKTASGLPTVASVRSIAQAVASEPVKHTPAMRGSPLKAAPTVSPSPGNSSSTSRGTPASCSKATARAAISGVCSAGLASTGLPATSAAASWPVKIANGKFHGDMHANGPHGLRSALVSTRRAWAA